MATTPIELRTIPGLTLTADLYALGNDTVVQAGITLTEQINRGGFYRGNITAAASGWHTLSVKLGTAVIDIFDIANLQDTTDLQYARTAGDQSAIQSAAAAAITAAQPIRANAVEIGGVSVEPADISQDVRDAMELESTSGEDSIDDKLNALSSSVDNNPTAQEIWNYSVRTLTQSSTQIINSINNSNITIYRGDTFSCEITGLGDLPNRTYLWFTVKRIPATELDISARIQITEDGGLTRINGQAYTETTHGSLTVGAEEESVIIYLHGAATSQLQVGQTWYYDLQVLDSADNPKTIASGELTVTADVTRATE